MKKAFFFLMVCVSAALFLGCKSTAPFFYSFSESTDYTILGEVTYSTADAIGGVIAGGDVSKEDLMKTGGGYMALLAAAKQKYPNCDYVIDVMVDTRITNYFFMLSYVYVMRGVAIKYN
jgi:hypothetical protein